MFEKNRYSNMGKSRRGIRVEKQTDKKTHNLKQLHRTFCEESEQHYHIAERSSAAQLLLHNRQSMGSIATKDNKKPKREQSVNFYINIDKLKNLKIESKDKLKHEYMSAYLKNNINQNNSRKSMLLRNYGRDKKTAFHSSHEYGKKKLNRSSQHNPYHSVQQKSKVRYKTHGEEKQEPLKSHHQSNQSKGYIMKRNHLKKAPQEVKDKTFIEGYLKGKQLGRGGFSKVWEGFHFESKAFYAVKEIDTQNKYQTHLTQIWFGNYFFKEGVPRSEFSQHPGIQNLLKMYTYAIMEPRAFIVYESCEGSLGNLLYDIYEEEGKDQINEDDKMYMIKYKKLYNQLRKSTQFLKCLIYEISQALDLLEQNKIIHSDIKTQNILLQKDQKSNSYRFKLIDYGSSFLFESLRQYKLATPEYMCPELLNFILYENKKQHYHEMLSYVKNYQNLSAIDVWGLGCIVLELIHGLPLWLTNPTKVFISGKYETKKGLFAVSDRSFAKILERQLYVIQNIDSFLLKNNNSGIMIDKTLKNLLVGMLKPNPHQRIKPHQILALLKNS